MLGARLRVEETEDVASAAITVARAIGTTYILLGTPRRTGRLGRLGRGPDLLSRLLDGLPGVDVRIVTDPTLRSAPPPAEESSKRGGLAGESGEGVRAPAIDAGSAPPAGRGS